jgi:HK97 family phage prohead protease
MNIRLLHPTIRSPKDSPSDSPPGPVIEFISSDETLDRYQEVILASGWQLERYRRNPVFQNSHQYGDILFTLGRAEVTEVRNGSLFQRVRFAVGENPVARIAYDLYRGGFLNAVSVGFLPIEVEEGGKADPWRRRFVRQELLETSAVSLPANPNALALAVKSGAVTRSDLLELYDLLRHITLDFGHLDLGPSAPDAPTLSPSDALRSDAPTLSPPLALADAWRQFKQTIDDIRAILRRA